METTRLLAQITDADEEVRGEAIHELTHLMDDEVARAFLDVASSGADEQVRSDVLIGLGPVIDEAGIDYDDDEEELLLGPELGPPVSREMFETIVREVRALYEDESQPKRVRRSAFEALVRDPQPWVSSEIRRHFASDDPEWKLTAVFAMGYVAGFEKEIAAVVNAEQGQLLIEGVKAAGHMEVTGAAQRIRDLATAKGTERGLRLYAIEALPYVDPDSFDILDRLKQSNDEEVAEAAEAALEELSLAESMDDEEWDDEEWDEEDEEDDRR
ncbi:MAG TPA: hypothetical protein VF432_28490 [Thermoanaerobaculia bacterium]